MPALTAQFYLHHGRPLGQRGLLHCSASLAFSFRASTGRSSGIRLCDFLPFMSLAFSLSPHPPSSSFSIFFCITAKHFAPLQMKAAGGFPSLLGRNSADSSLREALAFCSKWGPAERFAGIASKAFSLEGEAGSLLYVFRCCL